MKLTQIISEVEFNTYVGMVRITYQDISPSKVAELIRALPGVTTVTLAGQNEATNQITLKVKLITQKTGEEAFAALKNNAVSKYTPVKVVEIGSNTIERK